MERRFLPANTYRAVVEGYDGNGAGDGDRSSSQRWWCSLPVRRSERATAACDDSGVRPRGGTWRWWRLRESMPYPRLSLVSSTPDKQNMVRRLAGESP
nr:hypothetical protein Itr_chr15CG13570 [Ipomoea trifida]